MGKDVRRRFTSAAGRNVNAQATLQARLQKQLDAARSGFTVDSLFDPLLTGGDPAAVLSEAQRICASEAYAGLSAAERFYAHGLLYMGWAERPAVPGTEEPSRFACRGLSTQLYTGLVLALGLQHEFVQTLVVSYAGLVEESVRIENIAKTIEKVLQTVEEREAFDSLWNQISHTLLKETTPQHIKEAILTQKRRFCKDFTFEGETITNEEKAECFESFKEDTSEVAGHENFLCAEGHSAEELGVLCEITDDGAPGTMKIHEDFTKGDFLFTAASKSKRALLSFISSPPSDKEKLEPWMQQVTTLSNTLEEAEDALRVTQTYAENVLSQLNNCQINQNIIISLEETFFKLFHKLSKYEKAEILHTTRERGISFHHNAPLSVVSLFNRSFEGCTEDDNFVLELQEAALCSPEIVLDRTLQMALKDSTKEQLTAKFLQLQGYEGTDRAINALINSSHAPSGSLLATLVDSNFGTIENTIYTVMTKGNWDDLTKIHMVNSFLQTLRTPLHRNDSHAYSNLITKAAGYACSLCELSLRLESCSLLETLSERVPDVEVVVENGVTYEEWKRTELLSGYFETGLMPASPKYQRIMTQRKISFAYWLTSTYNEREPLNVKDTNQFECTFEFVEACTLSDRLAQELPERLNAMRGVPPLPLILATEAFKRNVLLASACILSRATDKEFERLTEIALPKLVSFGLYTPEPFEDVSSALMSSCTVFQSLWLLSTPSVVSGLPAWCFSKADFYSCVGNMVKHLSAHVMCHAQDDLTGALRLGCSLYTIPLLRMTDDDDELNTSKVKARIVEQARILCLGVIRTVHDKEKSEVNIGTLKGIIDKLAPAGEHRQELEKAIVK